MAYVYLHKTKCGRPFYIGISNNNDGYKRATNTQRRNPYWKNVVKKWGFEYEILTDGLSWNEAQQWERRLIKEYREKGYQLTNMTDGGEGTLGYRRTSADIRKITEKNSKRKVMTVGGLIKRLSGYHPDSPIYFGDVKRKDGVILMDNLTMVSKRMEAHDTPHQWDDDGWDKNEEDCVVLFGANHYGFVKEKMELEKKYKELEGRAEWDESEDLEKRLDEINNKLIVFRYIDTILH